MAPPDPNKKDIETLFKRLRNVSTNKVCFDCTAKNPTWASVTYGVFICIDCSAVHRSLGVHLTFVRSTQLDTNWTWIQLHKMQLGGNANAELFFVQHNCTTKDAQTKYNSRAAQLYREKLNAAANTAMALHGTKLNLEPESSENDKNEEEPFDFFSEHTADPLADDFKTEPAKVNDFHESIGPSVTLQSSDDFGVRKSTIGARKPQIKKTMGLSMKKSGGLGAQKVNANFAEIEKQAELADKLKVHEGPPSEEKPQEEQEEQLSFVRLAYEDLSLKQKKEEEKMKSIDPKKAQQMERLGMGFGARSGVSHSALSDMKTIQQENLGKLSSKSDSSSSSDSFFDDFGFSSGGSSSYLPKKSPSSPIFSSKDPSIYQPYKSSKISDDEPKSFYYSDNTPRKPVPSSSSANASSEAQKKFGSAKSISSDQYFSDSSESTWERKSSLQRFEGSTSISSADYFGRNESYNRGGGIGGQIQTPDLEDVKESVRQGVTKVAGRLSSLATGVMSSIQEKYGGY